VIPVHCAVSLRNGIVAFNREVIGQLPERRQSDLCRAQAEDPSVDRVAA
jgi:hypothetical protein